MTQQITNTLATLHQAFNADEADVIQACYTDSAKVIAKPTDNGKHPDAYQALAAFRKQYAAEKLVSQGDEVVIQADDVALVISKIYLSDKQDKTGMPCEPKKAIYVLKRGEDGQWRCAIDNFFGAELIDYV